MTLKLTEYNVLIVLLLLFISRYKEKHNHVDRRQYKWLKQHYVDFLCGPPQSQKQTRVCNYLSDVYSPCFKTLDRHRTGVGKMPI